jgi:hypothetical protein
MTCSAKAVRQNYLADGYQTHSEALTYVLVEIMDSRNIIETLGRWPMAEAMVDEKKLWLS